MEYPMIIVSREHGTHGREIAELLAKSLGLPYYDRERILQAAQTANQSGSASKAGEESEESELKYALSHRSDRSLHGMPEQDRLFMLQAGIIQDIARRGPAVIVGRCADYILEDVSPCVTIFIHAADEERIARVKEKESLSQREAEHAVKRLDRERASYYNYYTGRRWSDLKHYDITMNVTHLTAEEAAEILETYIRKLAEQHMRAAAAGQES